MIQNAVEFFQSLTPELVEPRGVEPLTFLIANEALSQLSYEAISPKSRNLNRLRSILQNAQCTNDVSGHKFLVTGVTPG